MRIPLRHIIKALIIYLQDQIKPLLDKKKEKAQKIGPLNNNHLKICMVNQFILRIQTKLKI